MFKKIISVVPKRSFSFKHVAPVTTTSFSQKSNIRCPNCGRKFRFEVWLIVNTDERPDLFPKIYEGTIHYATCTHCNKTAGEIDAPLLIYQPDKDPLCIFSPSRQTTKDQDQQQAFELMQHLRRTLGETWRNSWVQDDIIEIPRESLSRVFDDFAGVKQKLHTHRSQVSYSHSEQAPLKCPNCSRVFGFDIWVLVEVNEHPELLELIMRRNLLRFSCPYCGFVGKGECDVLVFSLMDPSFLIFSVTDYPPDKRSQQLFDRFIYMLGGKIGGAYLFALLEQCDVVSESVLPQKLLEKMPSERTQFSISNTADLLDKLDKAETFLEKGESEDFEAALMEVFFEAASQQEEGLLSIFAEFFDHMENDLRENHPDEFSRAQKEIEDHATNRPGMPNFPHFITRTPMRTMTRLLPIIQELGQLSEEVKDMPRRVELCRQALSILPREENPFLWAGFQDTLANGLTFSPKGDRGQNLEKALEHNKLALEVISFEEFPEQWANLQRSLATIYSERTIGDTSKNIELAISCYKKALQIFTEETYPEQWAAIHYHLGLVYMARHQENKSDNLQSALYHCSLALKVYTFENNQKEWARVHNNIGLIYLSKSQYDPIKEDIELAISHFTQALKSFASPDSTESQAFVHNNLVVAYSHRKMGIRSENVKKAIEHSQECLKVHTRINYPFEHLKVCRNLGDLYFTDSLWAEALEAYMDAIQTGEDLIQSTYTDESLRIELGETSMLYSNAVYCLCHLGRYGEGLEQLEASKARILYEALAINHESLDRVPDEYRKALGSLRQEIRDLESQYRLLINSDYSKSSTDVTEALQESRFKLSNLIKNIQREYPEFMPKGLDLSRILSIVPSKTSLIAPVFTTKGSVVYVIPSDVKEISIDHIIFLDDFDRDNLIDLLLGSQENPGWLWGYLDTDRNIWMMNFELLTKRLWDLLLEPIHNRLKEQGVKKVIFIPQGGLGLLPIHAAWRLDNSEKRYFIDDYIVSYTPSAYALYAAQRHTIDNKMKTALIAGVSQYENLSPLPNARFEVEAIASLFRISPLIDEEVTCKTIIEETSGRRYIHFSCHGKFSWDNALASALILSQNEKLTLSDILGRLDLNMTRLVTLSACETGIIDVQRSPEEYIGLSTGFMQAGAIGVLSSLWTVEDRSTALLMEYFYRLHIKDNVDPAEALQSAQLWLKGLTRLELGQYYQSFYHLNIDEVKEFSAEVLLAGSLEDKLYNHPFYWSAFVFNGI